MSLLGGVHVNIKFTYKIKMFERPVILGGIYIEINGIVLTGRKSNPNEIIYNEEYLDLFIPSQLEKINLFLNSTEKIISQYYNYPGGIIIFHPKNELEIGIQVGGARMTRLPDNNGKIVMGLVSKDDSRLFAGDSKIYFITRVQLVESILTASTDFIDQIKNRSPDEDWIKSIINKIDPLIMNGNKLLNEYKRKYQLV